MTSTKLPNELWMEVLKELPRDVLLHISLASGRFRSLSAPLLFRHLDFHPYGLVTLMDGRLHLLPPMDVLERAKDRLAFWCSDRIAPAVQSCKITPTRTVGREWSSAQPDMPRILLDLLFENLHHFHNLRHLTVEDVFFTASAMDQLCRLSMLRSIRLSICKVQTSADSLEPNAITLSLSTFSLRSGELKLWLFLLHPDHLHELDVHGAEIDCLCSVRPFPHVRTVSIAPDLSQPAKIDQAIEILSKFPGVEVLRILPSWREVLAEMGRRKRPHLPALRELTIHLSTLSIFLPGSAISRLTIDSSCSPSELREELFKAVEVPTTITALNLSLSFLNAAELEAIMPFFHRLLELKISVYLGLPSAVNNDNGMNTSLSSFFTALPDIRTLPSTLQVISISFLMFSFGPQRDDEYSDLDIPDAVTIQEALVARCPALSSLLLDGIHFLFYWRVKENGTIDCKSSTDLHECEQIRKALWESR